MAVVGIRQEQRLAVERGHSRRLMNSLPPLPLRLGPLALFKPSKLYFLFN